MTYPGKSREVMARRTVAEVEYNNNFEKYEKIKANNTKFKTLKIAVEKKNNIIIDGTKIKYSPNAIVLGLTIGNQGIAEHVEETTIKTKRIKTPGQSIHTTNSTISTYNPCQPEQLTTDKTATTKDTPIQGIQRRFTR